MTRDISKAFIRHGVSNTWGDVGGTVGTLGQSSANSSEPTSMEADIDEMSVAVAVGVEKVDAEEWRAES
jgi:hypothetical protein